ASANTRETPAPKPNAAQERELKKQLDRETRKLRNAITKLETEIAELETELDEMDRIFIADATQCTVENCNKYEEKKRMAAAKTDEWAALQEKLEGLES
ncbi:MAG: hypothetical protein K2O66_00255, partial [Bacteroidales bacterium]|nr:hypothetical protein [Bacteroidales bacterium]